MNCAFKSNHSYNVGRLVSGSKWWEGSRGRPLRAKFMACASVKVDKQGGTWASDTSIQPSYLYTLSYIESFSKPGREYAPAKRGGRKHKWFCDWIYKYTYAFDPPIYLPNGVGQGLHYPSNPHSRHLRRAFIVAQERIQKGCGCTLVRVRRE